MFPQDPQPGRAAPRRLLVGAALLFAAVWLATLAGRSLVSADEGRYASLSLAMLQSGDWITPRLNGLLYFEKPPLQYWGGALAMALFGIDEFAARLWPGLAGLATVFMLGFTARRLWGPRAGLHATLVAGSTSWIVLNSHFLTLDAGLTATLTLVLCAVLIAERGDATRWWLAAWAGMGLAVLSKGPVGIVIPGAAIVLQSLWRMDFSLWRRLRWLPGLPTLLAITLPWFVLVSLRNPSFPQFFFIHEHVQRYLTPVAQRTGAWWYFLPVLLGGLLPWTGALPWILRPRRADFAASLLLCWAGFVFFFFSASDSKLASYILPMFPALVLLVAERLQTTGARVLARHLGLPSAVWLLLLAAAPVAWNRAGGPDTPPTALHALLLGVGAGALIFLAAATAAWALLRRNRQTAALAAVAAGQFVALLLLLASHDRFGQLKSSDAIARALAGRIDPATPVYAVRDYDQTLPFYLRRPVILVDVRDEFEFGENLEPRRWIPNLDGFIGRWNAEPRAAAYMSRATFDVLRARGLAMQIVYEDPRRLMVVKP